MMKKEFGKEHLYSEIFIEDDETYIISTIKNNGNLYNIKVSKLINIYRIYYKINFEYVDLDKVNHLIDFQDTSTTFEKYPKIVDNILHSQFLEFSERKKRIIKNILF